LSDATARCTRRASARHRLRCAGSGGYGRALPIHVLRPVYGSRRNSARPLSQALADAFGEARPNSQLYSAAQSREQAALLFSLAAKIVRLSSELSVVVVIRDTAKQLFCPDLGTLYRALSAEASTAFGLSPVFAVHDELGQVKGPTSELYDAIETATGAQENPLSIVISTQAPTDADLLSVLIDDALAGGDPRTTVSLYTANIDAMATGRHASPTTATVATAMQNWLDHRRPKVKGVIFTTYKRRPPHLRACPHRGWLDYASGLAKIKLTDHQTAEIRR
jgi:hypothetical protein